MNQILFLLFEFQRIGTIEHDRQDRKTQFYSKPVYQRISRRQVFFRRGKQIRQDHAADRFFRSDRPKQRLQLEIFGYVFFQ